MEATTWQTICQVGIAFGMIVTGLCGFGAYHFGKKADAKKPSTSVPLSQQNHSGAGDNVGRDKFEVNLYGSLTPQLVPPQVKTVSIQYPEQSGLQARLKAEGYSLRWSKEELRAGYEPVIETLNDGTRVIFKDSNRELTLLKRRVVAIPQATLSHPVTVAPTDKVPIKRTPHQLLALYKVDGLNPIQVDDVLNPFKGQWIEAQGQIVNMVAGLPNGDQAGIVLRDSNDTIECRFGPQWKDHLSRLKWTPSTTGDTIKIKGKVGPSQNHSQLYLVECEILQVL